MTDVAGRCRLCGSTPASFVESFGAVVCDDCNANYVVRLCERCGIQMTTRRGYGEDRRLCAGCLAEDRWAALPEALRSEIDELVLKDEDFAIHLLLRPPRTKPQMSIREARELIATRYRALHDQISFRPERGPDLEGLARKTETLTDPLVAFEAMWDGDTEGWFLLLFAIVERPGKRHERYDDIQIGFYHRRNSDLRLINGKVPPWPEAEEAARDGEALALRFNVPFHFPSPNKPDFDYPRWWDADAH